MTGEVSTLTVLFNSEDFADYLLKTEISKKVAKHDRELIETLKNDITELNNSKTEVETSKADLEMCIRDSICAPTPYLPGMISSPVIAAWRRMTSRNRFWSRRSALRL